jgi:acetylornithine deacetylase/succinyl-diaminopimelate desuccinylase-like protein
VGEEGEGDLRGVRHLYNQDALAGRIAAHIVLDGAGADSAVTQALGSRRFLVAITGPGGHSFTDAGAPNPIAALASALANLSEILLPEEPRTTLNLGTILGGTSVKSLRAHKPPSISVPPAPTNSCVLKSRCIAPSKMPSNTRMLRQRHAAGEFYPLRSPRSATARRHACPAIPRCLTPCAPSTVI